MHFPFEIASDDLWMPLGVTEILLPSKTCSTELSAIKTCVALKGTQNFYRLNFSDDWGICIIASHNGNYGPLDNRHATTPSMD